MGIDKNIGIQEIVIDVKKLDIDITKKSARFGPEWQILAKLNVPNDNNDSWWPGHHVGMLCSPDIKVS